MSDTGPAKLPGIPAYRTDDNGLAATLQAIIERLEVREGSRGNPAERAITQRDLDAYVAKPAVVTQATQEIDINALVQQIVASPAFLAALPKAETQTRGWVNELRAAIEGIRSRLAGMVNAIASEPLFNANFFWGNAKDQANFASRGYQWTLRSTTGLGSVESEATNQFALTVQDVLSCVSAGFSGQVSTGTIKLRDDIKINNVADAPVQTLGAMATTVMDHNRAIWEYSGWFNFLFGKFEGNGQGRMTWVNMPLVSGLYDTEQSILKLSERIEILKAHAGYTGPWP